MSYAYVTEIIILKKKIIEEKSMPSFDIVSKTDLSAFDNAIDGLLREINTRYDFKGSKCNITKVDDGYSLIADSEQKRKQMFEILLTHMIRKKVASNALDKDKIEVASGNMIRQNFTVKQGIKKEISQIIVKAIKSSKIKVQVAVQGAEIRVTGKKRDDLQVAMGIVSDLSLALPISYVNFRD